MKITTVFASLVLGLASAGMAQAADAPASEVNTPSASTSHDPYYPQVVSTTSKTRAEVVKELQQAQADGSLAATSHNAYYPMHVSR